LIDAGISPDATYEGGGIVALRVPMINLLKLLLSTADLTNDQGLKIAYDRKAVEERIRVLEIEAGIIVEKGPVITSKRVW
jgi:hypothetical protein